MRNMLMGSPHSELPPQGIPSLGALSKQLSNGRQLFRCRVPSWLYDQIILIDASACSEAISPFTMPNNQVLSPIARNGLKSFTVSGLKKATIRSELSLLGINFFSVYGDLENLARYLTKAYTTSAIS